MKNNRLILFIFLIGLIFTLGCDQRRDNNELEEQISRLKNFPLEVVGDKLDSLILVLQNETNRSLLDTLSVLLTNEKLPSKDTLEVESVDGFYIPIIYGKDTNYIHLMYRLLKYLPPTDVETIVSDSLKSKSFL
jgi:hypothetical protein